MPLSEPSESPKPSSWIVANWNLLVVWLLMGLGIFVVFRFFSAVPELPNPEEQPGVGNPIAHVDLLPLTGAPPSISRVDLRGRVTLINFWGTWCPPCRAELPHMAAIRNRFAGQKTFQLLAVSCPSSNANGDVESLREETQSLLTHTNLELPTYYDPDMATRAAVDQLTGRRGYPLTLLLDRRGIVRAIWLGYWPGVETQMERLIERLLEED